MALREKLRAIIFGTDTTEGRAFDIGLVVAILASVLVVMLDTVDAIQVEAGPALGILGWLFTIFFTLEYFLRLYAASRPREYAFSFFGVVDFLAVFPFYFAPVLPATQYVIIIRVLRLLRIFRIFKLSPFERETANLIAALRASSRRIIVFLLIVFTLVVILGSCMYVIEDEAAGFTSIPTSVYWAIVTLTTVGYGDISPRTGIGQALAGIIMILGYSLIIVPTGFISVAARDLAVRPGEECPRCQAVGHAPDARFCRCCGHPLP